jgi:hypothetical protein
VAVAVTVVRCHNGDCFDVEDEHIEGDRWHSRVQQKRNSSGV